MSVTNNELEPEWVWSYTLSNVLLALGAAEVCVSDSVNTLHTRLTFSHFFFPMHGGRSSFNASLEAFDRLDIHF